MCIAIVKKIGAKITEEALKNSWDSNNDGAGFCCLDYDNNFIIYKSMTWLGFIEEYRIAEELYGDTSAFLIHFRITSKGDTCIDNCHPFQVDDDRVIIHNGTITAIPMSKKESRSDTKIFAEEYLRNLPADWEDNAVIYELIEEYVGYSKVCMFHKTKGIFIFNEGMGHWVDDVWYSNDSYKTRYSWDGNKTGSASNYYDNLDNTARKFGFYSKLESKFITANTAFLMTDVEIRAHLAGVSRTSWIKCDNCLDYNKPEDMLTYIHDGTSSDICIDCWGIIRGRDVGISDDVIDNLDTTKDIITLGKCQCCNTKYPTDTLKEYFSPEEQRVLTLCELCFAWAQEYEIELNPTGR